MSFGAESATPLLVLSMKPSSRRHALFPLRVRSCVSLALFALPLHGAGAQTDGVVASFPWRAWAFARVGPAVTSLPGSQVFGSAEGGVAASYRELVGMVRATDNEKISFEDNPAHGEQYYAALAGARTRGDRLFVAGALGVARSVRHDVVSDGGELTSRRTFDPAFDASAHADFRIAGLAVAISGIAGPPSVRYVAFSLGAELGWFGSR
jgi:hypothetical protein